MPQQARRAAKAAKWRMESASAASEAPQCAYAGFCQMSPLNAYQTVRCRRQRLAFNVSFTSSQRQAFSH